MTAIPERLVVLLAEDDENDLFIVQRVFKRLGKAVRLIAVSDGDEVIAYLSGDGKYSDRQAWPIPNVVFLDQWMPRISGTDVLCWIRTEPRYRSLPVVLMSGGLSPAQREFADRFKAAHCAKDVEPKNLMQVIGRAVGAALGLTTDGQPTWASTLRHSLFTGPEPIRVWT